MLLDPSAEEEELRSCGVSVVWTVTRDNLRTPQMSGVFVQGGMALDVDTLRVCVTRAQDRVRELSVVIDAACDTSGQQHVSSTQGDAEQEVLKRKIEKRKKKKKKT